MRVSSDVDCINYRSPTMDDTVSPFEYREAECSGRSLATLLVAWVSAAMVASVLLRWKYMWIALAVLTLLFLIACGYAACTTRRNMQRDILRNEARYVDQRRMEIQTISGDLVNCQDRAEPPAYWITDLPPPYAAVIGTEPPPPPEEERAQLPGPRLSNPPPYSLVVQQAHVTAPPSTEQPISSTISHVNSIDVTTNAIPTNDNKDVTEQSPVGQSQHVLTSSTQYLSNLISNTFGRAQRSRNLEQNLTQSTQRNLNSVNNQVNLDITGDSTRPENHAG